MKTTSGDDGLVTKWKQRLATPGLEAAQRLRLHLAMARRRTTLATMALAMHHFDPRTRAPGIFGVRLGAVFLSRSTPDFPLHAD